MSKKYNARKELSRWRNKRRSGRQSEQEKKKDVQRLSPVKRSTGPKNKGARGEEGELLSHLLRERREGVIGEGGRQYNEYRTTEGLHSKKQRSGVRLLGVVL